MQQEIDEAISATDRGGKYLSYHRKHSEAVEGLWQKLELLRDEITLRRLARQATSHRGRHALTKLSKALAYHRHH